MSIGYRLILSDGVRIKQEPHDDADPPGKISGRAAHAPWWKSPDICVSDEKAVLPGPDEEVVEEAVAQAQVDHQLVRVRKLLAAHPAGPGTVPPFCNSVNQS